MGYEITTRNPNSNYEEPNQRRRVWVDEPLTWAKTRSS